MFGKKHFVERVSFWTDKGGKWAAVNPDHKPGDKSPESFEYHTMRELSESVLEFSIYAYSSGQRKLIWKGYHYWLESQGKSVYVSLGPDGQVCNGGNLEGHEMHFEIFMPDGQAMYIRNLDEIVNEDEVTANARTIIEGEWRPMSSVTWKRIL